jgi:hypothetical protein
MSRTVPGRRRAALRVAQLLVASLLLFAEARAQSSVAPAAASGETQIKAAFICKFGNYVEWPAREKRPADAPFVIGVISSGKLVDELVRAASGQTANGRPIVVRKLAKGDPVDDLAVIFVTRGHAAELADALAAVRGRPILTITESDDAPVAGSMVNFVVVDDRVRFDIALQPAEQSSLKISGRLLALARKVTGAPS